MPEIWWEEERLKQWFPKRLIPDLPSRKHGRGTRYGG